MNYHQFEGNYVYYKYYNEAIYIYFSANFVSLPKAIYIF